MKRQLLTLLTIAIVFCGAVSLFAHEQYRIIGTITKFEKSQLEVKATKDGKIFKIALDDLSVVRRDKDKVKVTTAELRVGVSVVVDALGDSINDLVAVEIRLVPTPPKAPQR
jgi:hypothetical protein